MLSNTMDKWAPFFTVLFYGYLMANIDRAQTQICRQFPSSIVQAGLWGQAEKAPKTPKEFRQRRKYLPIWSLWDTP